MSLEEKFVSPVRERSLTEQIQTYLEEALRNGRLKPKDRTSIRELAERLGVSTMPVREAVSRLVAQGALSVERNRAIVVPMLSVADFRDLTHARLLTEGHATRLAASRIDPEALSDLRRLNASFEQAMVGDGSGDPVEINKRLHFRLYDAAGSPALSRIIAANWLLAGPIINLDIGLPSRRMRNANSLAAHAALLEALAARDADAAAAALLQDIQAASQFVIENALDASTAKEGRTR